jgi:Tfp pilus assembly protein PilF
MIRVAIILSLIFCAAQARGAAHEEMRANVIVFSRSIGQTSCGNGFVIGDGTLVVTARHVVYPERPSGLHQGDALVTILSPYLGDACEAEVIAHDRALDVAILRVPWSGHPAVPLADEAAVVSTDKVELAGYPGIIAAVTAGKPQLLEPSLTEESTALAVLDVNSVIVRQAATRSIVTGSAPVGGGWPGAAMLVPGTSSAAGCYARTGANGSAGVGAAAGAIRKLIEQAGCGALLDVNSPPRAPSAESGAATLQYLQAIAASSAGDARGSDAYLQAFLRLRPRSAIGFRDLAGQARAISDLDRAQKLYAEALQIEPTLVSARVLYGQLLHERLMPTHAMKNLRYAWEHGRHSRTAAVIPLCNLLREQGREREGADLLAEAVKQSPLDGYLWNYLGQSRTLLSDHAGAAVAFARSADLMPENASVRLKAADEYLAAGNRAKAEEQVRTAIAQNPESSVAYCAFAKLLAQDGRPDKALDAAKSALLFADRPGGVPRGEVQSLISAIRAGRASAAADFKL